LSHSTKKKTNPVPWSYRVLWKGRGQPACWGKVQKGKKTPGLTDQKGKIKLQRRNHPSKTGKVKKKGRMGFIASGKTRRKQSGKSAPLKHIAKKGLNGKGGPRGVNSALPPEPKKRKVKRKAGSRMGGGLIVKNVPTNKRGRQNKMRKREKNGHSKTCKKTDCSWRPGAGESSRLKKRQDPIQKRKGL